MPMKGALPIFRLAGIRVYLHFTWFIVAALEVTQFAHRYHNPIWAALEYCALFGVVLLHEFGHALACRQTGGQADTIVLWPLGGIAFVRPPARPGAYLWSMAAGPLVNVILFPLFTLVAFIVTRLHWKIVHPDFYQFVRTVWFMNVVLLFFNLIPVYPLDGGQILRGLLWLKVGPIRNSFRLVGVLVEIHMAGHTRVLHFRAGASRMARCSEPRYRIRGGCSPRRCSFSATNSRATTLSRAILRRRERAPAIERRGAL
jgi:Zn-dependent protease